MTEYVACKEAAEIAHEKTAMLRRVVEAQDPLHPETRRLIYEFSDALAAKLIKAQEKYGRKDDWRTDDWETECRAQLMRHIEKGDPLDVAAYCAFMWRRGWSTVIAKPSRAEDFIDAIRDVANDIDIPSGDLALKYIRDLISEYQQSR